MLWFYSIFFLLFSGGQLDGCYALSSHLCIILIYVTPYFGFIVKLYKTTTNNFKLFHFPLWIKYAYVIAITCAVFSLNRSIWPIKYWVCWPTKVLYNSAAVFYRIDGAIWKIKKGDIFMNHSVVNTWPEMILTIIGGLDGFVIKCCILRISATSLSCNLEARMYSGCISLSVAWDDKVQPHYGSLAFIHYCSCLTTD